MTTTGIILLCIAAVLVIALLAVFLILKVRARRFRLFGLEQTAPEKGSRFGVDVVEPLEPRPATPVRPLDAPEP